MPEGILPDRLHHPFPYIVKSRVFDQAVNLLPPLETQSHLIGNWRRQCVLQISSHMGVAISVKVFVQTAPAASLHTSSKTESVISFRMWGHWVHWVHWKVGPLTCSRTDAITSCSQSHP